ncbi:hypothetical protein EYM_04930 [Ignicoccus islandicus DSM 13165]|uniref:Uncharacterized protein n=1 Tax=Ignicoccus islandicus DSM 13165 TaxID=940295 RepID=A0A0U3F4Q1_9CREN|nr:hypothetical protein EYM_04930 [Ignicoccus islandicus DSM 13165]
MVPEDGCLDLVVAIDYTKSDPKVLKRKSKGKSVLRTVYGMVAVYSNDLKKLENLGHSREKAKKERLTALKKLPRTLEEMKKRGVQFYVVDYDTDLDRLVNRCKNLLERSKVLLVDDHAYEFIEERFQQVTCIERIHREGGIRDPNYRRLLSIADHVANFVRRLDELYSGNRRAVELKKVLRRCEER